MRQIMIGHTGVLMVTSTLMKVSFLLYFYSERYFLGEGYGLLEDDYVTIRHQWKIDQLQSIMPILSNHDDEI